MTQPDSLARSLSREEVTQLQEWQFADGPLPEWVWEIGYVGPLLLTLDAAEAAVAVERERADFWTQEFDTAHVLLKGSMAQIDWLVGRVDSLQEVLLDALSGMEWALSDDTRVGFWSCDCEPTYEWDTNACIHEESCASLWEGHFEATVAQLKALRGAAGEECGDANG
jgi:hypothetical protein